MTTYFEFYKKELFKLIEENKIFFTPEEHKEIHNTKDEDLKKRFSQIPHKVDSVKGLADALQKNDPEQVIKCIADFIPTLEFLQQDTRQLKSYMERLELVDTETRKKLCKSAFGFYCLAKKALELAEKNGAKN